MTDAPSIDWEDAFANGPYIPDGLSYPAMWEQRAAEFRASAAGEFDIAYGDHPRERYDLFRPSAEPKGLAVFVHGGYWLKFDKSLWSDLAAGALQRGWAVALPSYTLAPEATIPEITAQIAKAVATIAGSVDGPIRLAGHSAGGHLATRMVCEGGPLAPDVAARVERVVSVSGLHDLRPLLLHSMNEELRLTPETAASESPALSKPFSHVRVTAWVGARERPEFLRQSALLAEAWARVNAETDLVADRSRHHFDIIEGLKDPRHPLCLEFAGD